MPRPSLTDQHADAGALALFPSFQKEMNRLFDQFRNGFPMPELGTSPAHLVPAVDIVDTTDAMEITVEIPGVKEDDLTAEISGDVLTLKGEKTAEHEQSEENYHLTERRFGSFRRQIPLGFTPKVDAVSAEFVDGVLTLRIARPDEAKAEVREIKITKT